jgi:hypothetical protein
MCELESIPAAKIEWFYNETNITHKITKMREKYECIYEPEHHSATLIIKNVNVMDSGNYTLKAKNQLGECKSTCNLEVKSKNFNFK